MTTLQPSLFIIFIGNKMSSYFSLIDQLELTSVLVLKPTSPHYYLNKYFKHLNNFPLKPVPCEYI